MSDEDIQAVHAAIFEYRCVEKFGYALLHDTPPTSAYMWRMQAIYACDVAAQNHLQQKQIAHMEQQASGMKKGMR